MLFKLFGIIVTIILGAIIGLNISKNIENSVLYTLFWILYVVTYLTVANMIAIGLFYNVLQEKKGPPGARGPQGEPGDIGDEGICRSGCQEVECGKQLENVFITKINELANNPVPPIQFNNLYLKHQIKNICTSEQFKKVSEIKGADAIINYIKTTIENWANVIYGASGREFIESIGAEENFEWKGQNPFKELEKYDIYHWKTNKLFKPIGVDICDDPSINKNLPQKEKPRLFIVKTNIYDWIYNDKGSGANHDFSAFRPKSMYNKKLKMHMYPMGDIGVAYRRNENSGPKLVDGITINHDNIGPKKSSVLVAGDVTPPRTFQYKWHDKNSGGKYDGSFWYPVGRPGYTCIGDMVSGSHSPPSPNLYRCVPTECVERVSNTTYNGSYVWRDIGSGAKRNGSVWQVPGARTDGIGNDTGFQNYNLIRTVNDYSGNHAPFYKIKDACINSPLPPSKEHEPGDWISNKWHGYPERDPKYSIFEFLGLVPEGIIQNQETNNKYYFVSSSKAPNVYFIKYFHKTRFQRGNLEVFGDYDVKVNLSVNRDRIEQSWYLEYTDPNNVHIRSKKTDKYLGMHYYEGWKLIIKQYDKPHDKRTLFTIRTTSTGSRNIEQKKK